MAEFHHWDPRYPGSIQDRTLQTEAGERIQHRLWSCRTHRRDSRLVQRQADTPGNRISSQEDHCSQHPHIGPPRVSLTGSERDLLHPELSQLPPKPKQLILPALAVEAQLPLLLPHIHSHFTAKSASSLILRSPQERHSTQSGPAHHLAPSSLGHTFPWLPFSASPSHGLLMLASSGPSPEHI